MPLQGVFLEALALNAWSAHHAYLPKFVATSPIVAVAAALGSLRSQGSRRTKGPAGLADSDPGRGLSRGASRHNLFETIARRLRARSCFWKDSWDRSQTCAGGAAEGSLEALAQFTSSDMPAGLILMLESDGHCCRETATLLTSMIAL